MLSDEKLYKYEYKGPLKHPRMPLFKRCAQFAPFAALRGHSELIDETGIVLDERYGESEDDYAILDKVLKEIRDHIKDRPLVEVKYFEAIKNKDGGKYLYKKAYVKQIEEGERYLKFTDNKIVYLDELVSIKML